MNEAVNSRRGTLAVVMPNYNHARLLPRALDAILSQSRPPDEVIVLDDCSTDDSVAVIQRYADEHSHLRLIQNEVNLGAVGNMNRGLELVTSDYVCYAAADDLVQPGFFEKSMLLLDRHPAAGMSCTVGDWRDERTGLVSHIGVSMGESPAFFPPEQVARLEAAGRLMIPSNAVLFQTALLREIGGFDPELKWHCDWFSIYVLAFRHGFCFVPEPLAVFFMHAAGYSAKNPAKEAEHRQVMRKLVRKLDRPEFDDVRPAIQKSGALFCFGWPMRRFLKSEPDCRDYLNATFLRKNLWYAVKVGVKGYLPRWAGELYFWLTGARAKSNPSDG